MKIVPAILAFAALWGVSGCGSGIQSSGEFGNPGTLIVTTQRSILNGKADILLVLHGEKGNGNSSRLQSRPLTE